MLAAVLGRELIRLQCYEGIDTSQALYEWDYSRQLLHIRALGDGADPQALFGPAFLLERPLTSNRTRELHDALKRRCLYHWIDYPTAEREVEIVRGREPRVSEALARKVVAAVHRLREMDLAKPPGVAETLDWARTLEFLGEPELTPDAADLTLGSVLKEREDLELVRGGLHDVV